MSVCVCVCVRARACVCVCACVISSPSAPDRGFRSATTNCTATQDLPATAPLDLDTTPPATATQDLDTTPPAPAPLDLKPPRRHAGHAGYGCGGVGWGHSAGGKAPGRSGRSRATPLCAPCLRRLAPPPAHTRTRTRTRTHRRHISCFKSEMAQEEKAKAFGNGSFGNGCNGPQPRAQFARRHADIHTERGRE